MKTAAVTAMGALLVAGCGGDRGPAAAVCPVLPAVHATRAYEHRATNPKHGPPEAVSAVWPEYVLRADSGFARPRGGIAHLCGVHLIVLDSLGRTIADATADTGEFDRERDRIVARGRVVVDLPLQDRRIETEELHFMPRENRVWSPTTTTFSEGDVALTGTGFTADRHFESIRMEHARGGTRGGADRVGRP